MNFQRTGPVTVSPQFEPEEGTLATYFDALPDGMGGYDVFRIGFNSASDQSALTLSRYDAQGVIEATVTTAFTFDNAFDSMVDVLPLTDGGVFAVWNTSGQAGFRDTLSMFGQRVAADGSAVGERVSLFEADPREPFDFFGVAATVLPDGTIVALANEQELAFGPNSGDTETTYRTLYRTFDPDTAAQTGETVLQSGVVNLNPGASVPLSYEMEATQDGALAFISDAFRVEDVFFLRDPDGTVIGTPEMLTPGTNSEYPSDRQIIALDGGNTAVVWADEIMGGTIWYRSFAADGTAFEPQAQMIARPSTDWQEFSRSDALSSGGWVTAWLDYGGVVRRVFDPEPAVMMQAFAYDGTPLGAAERVIEWPEPDFLGADDGPRPFDLVVAEDDRIYLFTQDGVAPQRYTFDVDLPAYVRGGADSEDMRGGDGRDVIRAGDGADTVTAGAGDDTVEGGDGEGDLRDVLYGENGNDVLRGGYGNDALGGGAGHDTLEGGFGADTVIGNSGEDVLTGGALGDLLFGGAGDDFINGGFGFDRVNGGDGADQFFHLGVENHGSDWIQDYDGAEGDTLVFGNAGAARAQFQINIATTPGAGDAGVDEAFVIYRPTGQIVWALVDGAGQEEINLQIGGEVFDLTV